MSSLYNIKQLEPSDFAAVCELGNLVHGEGYLDTTSLTDMYKQSCINDLNASYVMYNSHTLIGFRISYAPNKWPLNRWCSPELWPIEKQNVAYFKCNTIHPDFQGRGLGGKLLVNSINTLKLMGAKAGLSHIWMQSPGNASYKYFTKAGGKLIKSHPRRWHEDESLADYVCIICGNDCYCDASEMMLEF